MLTTTDERRPGHRAALRERVEVRTDIQGLRAIAVSMVLVYHLWPGRLSGGFAGVDVFFVISGFLITSHLLAHPPRSVPDLARFWSRRIRRLLPAALLVLLATLAATRIVAADTLWANTAAQIKAAGLYVVNWRLADDAVDYLASQDKPTAVQHFWSLSVEEQFYLIWPVLILALIAAARLFHRRDRQALPVVLAGLGAVVAASLAYSVYLTGTDPARAYFVTGTRIWELGVGGLLAALLSRRALGRTSESEAVRLPAPARAALAWAGLAGIAYTAITYSGSTPFPGWRAAVPVLASAAVIAAAADTFGSPGPLLAVRPVQWLGDVSYSVYLWHWPLIVLVPFVSGNHLGLLDKATIIAVTLVLSGLSKRFIEDRFRTPAWGRPLWKPYLLGAVGMTIVVLGANALHTEVQHRTQQAQAAVRQVLEHHADCVGAAALAAPEGRCAPTTRSPVVPAPIAAAQDKSDAYGTVSGSKDCFATVGHSFPLTTCTRGDPAGRVKVALVGNSHAGEWVPTVEVLAAKYHWRITTYLASQCAFADTAQQFTPASKTDACSNWVHAVTDDIVARHYDLVIMTNRVSVQAVGHGWAGSWAPYRQGYLKVLRALHAARLNVVAIRDTPYPRATNVLVPDCLAAHPDDYTRCAGPRTEWLPRDPTVLAVAALGDPRIRMVDLTDYICEDTTCPAAVGKVVVYFDNSHLSASYAKTLAPYLAPHLRAALRR